MKVLAILQNQWFHDPERMRDILARGMAKGGSRHDFTARTLVDLTVHGGKDTVIILYGDDKEEIYKTLEDISGAPLPPAQVMPPTEGG
jgi:hypothetical protein